MLKKRVVACLVVRGGIVVQSVAFNKYLPVGKPPIAVEYLNQWGIDEIILVDISATKEGREPNAAMIRILAKKCFVPLTVGGGIKDLKQVRVLMSYGADKICINRSAISNPEFITDVALKYGNQCVVVSIDVTGDANSGYRVYDYLKRTSLILDAVEWARRVEKLGAGEIFITSVERDGTYRGFDIQLANLITEQVSIPVIACAGAGNAMHFQELFTKTSVSAGCAANFFHFTEHSVNITKRYLINNGVNVRIAAHADYSGTEFDSEIRLMKKDDKLLEDMRFIRIEKEII
jgi:imidazole glycerol-phosphate synthase subunit HisF